MLLRKKIEFYFGNIETPIGRAINLSLLILILLSCVIFVAQTYPIPSSVRTVLDVVDTLIGLTFVTEYLVRFWCADSKIKFLFNPYSLIDLMAITPFILRLTNLQYILVFRWFRLLKLTGCDHPVRSHTRGGLA
jgi:voltage-gated potassium channel